MLEDGRVGAHGGHEELLTGSPLYREIVEKGLPGQRLPTRKPLESTVARLYERAPRVSCGVACAGRAGAGDACAGWRRCLRPYRGRVTLMVLSLVVGTAATLAPAPLAAQAIDRGILPTTSAAWR